jgi:hypothetical protein
MHHRRDEVQSLSFPTSLPTLVIFSMLNAAQQLATLFWQGASRTPVGVWMDGKFTHAALKADRNLSSRAAKSSKYCFVRGSLASALSESKTNTFAGSWPSPLGWTASLHTLKKSLSNLSTLPAEDERG